jgi:leader peptidase (prepilin peptidase)/N-methyltransferase
VNPLLIAALALAGPVAGPAQRAVIFRLAVPAGESARRCCPACPSQALSARWPPWPLLSPTGRCPARQHRAGPPPLAVEAVTAILLAALAARIHPALVLAAACWLALCAVPLAFIDIAVQRLPDPLTASGYAGTALLLLVAAAASGHWHALARAALGGIALAGFCLMLALISPSGMGMGDVKAAASLGTMLAWRSWTSVIAAGLAGFLFAAAFGIALLISRRATRKQQIPFGPFMITGAFLIVLVGA